MREESTYGGRKLKLLGREIGSKGGINAEYKGKTESIPLK